MEKSAKLDSLAHSLIRRLMSASMLLQQLREALGDMTTARSADRVNALEVYAMQMAKKLPPEELMVAFSDAVEVLAKLARVRAQG